MTIGVESRMDLVELLGDLRELWSVRIPSNVPPSSNRSSVPSYEVWLDSRFMLVARCILLGCCAALAGDPDDFLCSTFTWLNGSELRRGVAYLVNPGSTIAFGNGLHAIWLDACWKLDAVAL